MVDGNATCKEDRKVASWILAGNRSSAILRNECRSAGLTALGDVALAPVLHRIAVGTKGASTMKRRKQTLLAVAASIGLLGGLQNFAYAQAQGKQTPPASGGQRGGDAGARDSGGGKSTPPSRSDSSPNDRGGNDGGEQAKDGGGARSPGRTVPKPTPPARTPAAP